MKRSSKNIIVVLVIIIALVASILTIRYIQTNSTSEGQIGTNQNMEQGDMDSSTIPEKPDTDDSTTPPDVPEGEEMTIPEDAGEAMTDGENPPEIPDGESMTETPPEIPDGQTMGEATSDTMGEAPNNMGDDMQDQLMSDSESMTVKSELTTLNYVVFAIEAAVIALCIMYLIMSAFNKKTLKETFAGLDQVIIYILATIILAFVLTLVEVYVTNSVDLVGMENNQNLNESTSNSEAIAVVVVDGESVNISYDIEATEEDQSIILVKNSGVLSLQDATLTKISGDSTNTENSEFYGINAGILVEENSTATIDGVTISTNAKGSNAVFSTGESSKIYISNSTITTTGESSARGLDATYGGYIEADNVNIKTEGGSCATLATDRGEGTVIAKNSVLETNGSGSPIIYSTGNISVENTTGVANGAQLVVIEGKNNATVTDSTFQATGAGNRGDTDIAGVMIYQSMSGDADEGTGTFTSENSTLEILSLSEYFQSAPMFFVTNTDAVINITNTTLIYGSNILLSAKGTSEWGNSGKNGGNVTLNATSQTLEGDIEVDTISTLTLNMTSSSYTGAINTDNVANKIEVSLDSASTLTLTQDSYITSLEDEDTTYSNINLNGYTLYVDGTALSK